MVIEVMPIVIFFSNHSRCVDDGYYYGKVGADSILCSLLYMLRLHQLGQDAFWWSEEKPKSEGVV
jgi:hypothetical protein